MILKIKRVKILDTIKVFYKDFSRDVAILVVVENGDVKEFKVLGICEFEGNPTSSRNPKDELEREIIERIRRILNKENVEKLLGKEINLSQ